MFVDHKMMERRWRWRLVSHSSSPRRRLAASATCPAPALAPRLIPHGAPPLDQVASAAPGWHARATKVTRTHELATNVNNKGSFSPQETWGTNTAPGYVNGIEISCAHCMQQNTSGALYTRWGNMACPAEHSTAYSGHMAAQLSSTNYGGSQYLCLTEKMAGLAKTRAGVFYCCCFV